MTLCQFKNKDHGKSTKVRYNQRADDIAAGIAQWHCHQKWIPVKRKMVVAAAHYPAIITVAGCTLFYHHQNNEQCKR